MFPRRFPKSIAILLASSINALPSNSGSNVAAQLGYQNGSTSQCRCFPGDSCWPSVAVWNAFNHTLGGKLIATVPIASVCHEDSFASYDAQACAELQSTFFFPETHWTTSSSIMAPYFTNNSCNPFTSPPTPCTLGNYISYAVRAEDPSDFQKTLAFVNQHNIRLTIRNTGHDYNGKSTGAGAVGIWTHNMKSTEVLDYKSAGYTGKAMKLGAGVQAIDAYKAAHAKGLVVVGGNCPTVGLAGGYTQGGGHSPLSSKFGLAADQALEWDVVTANGTLMTASPSQNSDMYWALSGGGGGTYGVVSSLTVKAHPDMRTSSCNLTFSSAGISEDSFWSVFDTFQQSLPSLVDAGAYAAFFVTPESFSLMPAQGLGVPQAKMQQLLDPTLAKLKEEDVKYTFTIDEFPTFLDSYNFYNTPWNVSQNQLGGRLIPRSLVETNNAALVAAQRKIIDTGAVMSGVAVNVAHSVSSPDSNSVNPEWRTSLFDAVVGTPFNYLDWAANDAYALQMTNELLPYLEDLTPNGGAYINEADFRQPDFQTVFYGSHYPALAAIKQKYDPEDLFYALTAVGSENWYEDQSQGGRLCKVSPAVETS